MSLRVNRKEMCAQDKGEAMRLVQQLFRSITYPVVGIVVALIIFDALKEGVFLPLFNGMYRHRGRAGSGVGTLESEELVVRAGPFSFRLGYMISRVLFALLVMCAALLSMWCRQKPVAHTSTSVPIEAAMPEDAVLATQGTQAT